VLQDALMLHHTDRLLVKGGGKMDWGQYKLPTQSDAGQQTSCNSRSCRLILLLKSAPPLFRSSQRQTKLLEGIICLDSLEASFYFI